MSNKAEKKEKIEKEPMTEKEPAMMYLGPTVFSQGLETGTVIKGDIEKRYRELFEKYPKIKKLFFKVDSDLHIKKRNVATKGTFENITFENIKQALEGGK